MDTAVPRLLGALLLLGAALLWNPQNPLWLGLATWSAFIAGAYLVTRAWFALFFTIALVTLAHLVLLQLSDAQLWIYSSAAIASGSICIWILAKRFRARIHETREARWQHRK